LTLTFTYTPAQEARYLSNNI